MKPLASALTEVGGVSTSTTSVTGRASGRVQPPNEKASMRSASTSRGWPSGQMTTVPSGSDSRSARQVLRSRPRSMPLPRRRRSVVIELDGTQRWIDGVAVRAIRVTPARRAGAVSGGQRDRVVEEEDRRPAVGPGQRHAPVAKLGQARDPQGRAAVVAHDLLGLIDDAAAVAGEQAAGAHRVQVSPRIHPVAARHHTTPSCQPATSVHIAVVTLARFVHTIGDAAAASCGVARHTERLFNPAPATNNTRRASEPEALAPLVS